MKKFGLIVLPLLIIFAGCKQTATDACEEEEFSFAFLTDIHVQPERNGVAGFAAAITEANALKPDFVITGGDLVFDALGVPFERADSLYNIYIETAGAFNMPVHNTPGNHELFGIYEKSGVDPSDPDYAEGMFRSRIGKTYYSFDYGDWHFMVLQSVQITPDRHYIGMVDAAQMEWIRQDLLEVDPKTPIVISTHIPFITVFTQVLFGEYAPDYHGLVVENAREVLDLFSDHNLKIVLQGHLHYLEDIEVYGIHFITAGAVSGQWWNGPNHEIEEGFLMVHVNGDDFCWEYVDYGWETGVEGFQPY
ncbi:MAG TPA: metallophosphoesterase [Bacteroidales bacterium]|nr:metallophosphoesterase [Bacteroidales bacterium]